MRNTTWFRQCVFVLSMAGVFNAPLAHSLVIGFQPDATFASTGDSIALNLVVSGLGNFAPDSLGAFDVSVGFDSAIFSFTSYSLGGYLGDLGLFEALDVSSGAGIGTVNLAEVSLLSPSSLDALQPGGFTLATLNFAVLDLPAGALTQFSILQEPILGDAFGNQLQPSAIGSAVIQGRESQVPAPGTLYLFIASILGWVVLRWSRVLSETTQR
jgi:hypothetical protein